MNSFHPLNGVWGRESDNGSFCFMRDQSPERRSQSHSSRSHGSIGVGIQTKTFEAKAHGPAPTGEGGYLWVSVNQWMLWDPEKLLSACPSVWPLPLPLSCILVIYKQKNLFEELTHSNGSKGANGERLRKYPSCPWPPAAWVLSLRQLHQLFVQTNAYYPFNPDSSIAYGMFCLVPEESLKLTLSLSLNFFIGSLPSPRWRLW